MALVALAAAACARLPEGFERPESYAFADTEDTPLGIASRDARQDHPGESGFLLLDSGLDAFVARTVLADGAERSIDAQYYILHDDLTGRLFVDRLLAAAERGVRVRLLLDDLDVADKEAGLVAADSHPNLEIRLFNPFARNIGRAVQFATRPGEVGRRMHNKSFVVDGQYAILGGRNIGNEYFEANADLAFADLDVMAIGPVVEEASRSFDEYWNSPLAYPASVLAARNPGPRDAAELRAWLMDYAAAQADSDYAAALRISDLARMLRDDALDYYWGAGQVVYDPPDKLREEIGDSERYLVGQLSGLLEPAQTEVIIISPYFVPGWRGVAALTALSERGVRVRVLTNSLASNDVLIVHSGYLKYRPALLRAGVELYELYGRPTREPRGARRIAGSSRASLHAKSFVIDRQSVFIGSLNLDPRAIRLNTEIGVVLHSPEMAGRMARAFDAEIERAAFRLELAAGETGEETLLWHGVVDGTPRVFDYEPYASVWQRFLVSFLSIFPIDSQL